MAGWRWRYVHFYSPFRSEQVLTSLFVSFRFTHLGRPCRVGSSSWSAETSIKFTTQKRLIFTPPDRPPFLRAPGENAVTECHRAGADPVCLRGGCCHVHSVLGGCCGRQGAPSRTPAVPRQPHQVGHFKTLNLLWFFTTIKKQNYIVNTLFCMVVWGWAH